MEQDRGPKDFTQRKRALFGYLCRAPRVSSNANADGAGLPT